MVKFVQSFLGMLFICSLISCNVEACSSSANGSGDEEKTVISVINWNTQTFFDAQTKGNEYADFLKSNKWNEEKYRVRLERLCDVIKNYNGDLYVFEELENEGILRDVYNQLSGKSWDNAKSWNYGSFYKDEKSSIGIGILSRFPVSYLKVHSMDIRCYKEKQPSVRPIIEAGIEIDGKDFVVIGNHWKSMNGGENETEIWRLWQESVLSEVLKDKACFVVCGDLNKDVRSFVKGADFTGNEILLRGLNQNKDFCVKVKTPWLTTGGSFTTKAGSYYYQNNWNRIDHFFTNESVQLTNFRVLSDEPLGTEDGTPNEYKIYNGEGYSDHFPIMCTLIF